jgi:nucleotide-binding universal stress UspA family protein
MKTILVPIDNSQVSKGAVIYACNVAAVLGCEIILLSVLNASAMPTTLMNWRKLEQQMVEKELEDVANMIQEIRTTTETEVKLTHEYVLGFPVPEVISNFARENRVDLVVMGTSGARGLKKLVGSNAASVIDGCRVPVIAVPKGASTGVINRILFATDMSHLDDEIKTIAEFARAFNAEVEVVHLIPEGQRKRSPKELEGILIRMAKYSRIHLTVLKGIDIAKDLRDLASTQKADMIVMFTHELAFFEKLFGKGNTRRVASNSALPLLAFNRTNTQS